MNGEFLFKGDDGFSRYKQISHINNIYYTKYNPEKKLLIYYWPHDEREGEYKIIDIKNNLVILDQYTSCNEGKTYVRSDKHLSRWKELLEREFKTVFIENYYIPEHNIFLDLFGEKKGYKIVIEVDGRTHFTAKDYGWTKDPQDKIREEAVKKLFPKCCYINVPGFVISKPSVELKKLADQYNIPVNIAKGLSTGMHWIPDELMDIQE